MQDTTQSTRSAQQPQEQHVEELAGPDDFWLTITDAARATRRQDVSIRRWIAKGLLPVRRQNVGLNQRTRLVRASDLARLTPIIDPAGAISSERGRLDLTSIPVQQARIKTSQEQILARLDQLAQDIQTTGNTTMQALREQESRQEQAISALMDELRRVLATKHETLSSRLNEVEETIARQQDSTTQRLDELTSALDRQNLSFEQAIEQAQTRITLTETLLSQHIVELREQVTIAIDSQQQAIAELRQHLDETAAQVRLEIEQREQLAQFVVQIASTVTLLEQATLTERQERLRLEQRAANLASSLTETRANLEQETRERITLSEQLSRQAERNDEERAISTLSLTQMQEALTSLQQQVRHHNNDYMKFIIRQYRTIDHDEVWELHKLALQEAGAFAGNGPWENDLHHIEQVYLHNGGEFLVGTCDNRIVAMGAFRRTDAERAEIKRMRVHPEYQRRGFGQLILQELEAQALAKGYAVLYLDTSTVQEAAQALYRKYGYHETGETKESRGFTDIYFEKRIS